MTSISTIKTLKPVQTLAETKPCGTRLKYKAGCKCMRCRAANSQYEVERTKQRKSGNWNGIVSAKKVQKHIEKLSKNGIGYKTIADIAGMAKTSIWKIKAGERKNLRAVNEKKILAINKNCLANRALISSERTKKRITRLLEEGFTNRELAKRLGYKSNSLQLRDQITAEKALKIKRFYDTIFAGVRKIGDKL